MNCYAHSSLIPIVGSELSLIHEVSQESVVSFMNDTIVPEFSNSVGKSSPYRNEIESMALKFAPKLYKLLKSAKIFENIPIFDLLFIFPFHLLSAPGVHAYRVGIWSIVATSATLMIKIVTVACQPEDLHGLSDLFDEVRSPYPSYPVMDTTISGLVELSEMISCTLTLSPALANSNSCLESAMWVYVMDNTVKIKLVCDMNMIIFHNSHFIRAKISKNKKRVELYDDASGPGSTTLQQVSSVFSFDDKHCYLSASPGDHCLYSDSVDKYGWIRDYGLVFTIFCAETSDQWSDLQVDYVLPRPESVPAPIKRALRSNTVLELPPAKKESNENELVCLDDDNSQVENPIKREKAGINPQIEHFIQMMQQSCGYGGGYSHFKYKEGGGQRTHHHKKTCHTCNQKTGLTIVHCKKCIPTRGWVFYCFDDLMRHVAAEHT